MTENHTILKSRLRERTLKYNKCTYLLQLSYSSLSFCPKQAVSEIGFQSSVKVSKLQDFNWILINSPNDISVINAEQKTALSILYHPPAPAAFEDTGHFAIFVDDHEVGEVPGDALGNDPLQGQTSSVVHVGVWDYRGQLLTKPHRPLQDRHTSENERLNWKIMNELFSMKPQQTPIYHLRDFKNINHTLYVKQPQHFITCCIIPSWKPYVGAQSRLR